MSDDDRPEVLRILFPAKTPARANGKVVPPVRIPTTGEVTRYASVALDYEVDTVARAQEGTRNRTLNAAAFNISQLVAGGYLPHNDAWAALSAAAQSTGLSATETNNTLHSAFAAGQAHPRVIPDRHQESIPGATILHLDPMRHQVLTDAGEPVEDAVDIEGMFPRLDWHALWADDSVDEWILQPLIPARRLVALFSPPKLGKSLLMLEIAVIISIGNQRCLGEMLGEGIKVLYVDFENDPRGDVRSRLQAMRYKPEDLGNLYYLSFPSLPYLDTVMGGLQLLAIAQHYGVSLVIIDTISRAIQGEENVNDTWLSFYRNTGVRLKDAGIACVRLDHSGKDVTKGMRGGSAKYGDVDAVWAMSALDDTHFQLECTDNRLPITEKMLTLERVVGPPLQHKVDMTFKHDQRKREKATALQQIPLLDPPVKRQGKHGGGARQVWQRLRALGYDVSFNNTKEALEQYRLNQNVTEYEEQA